MLSGEKILITGPAGQIAFPMASFLAKDNEVWGLARFSDPASRELVKSAGIKPVACDLGAGNFEGVPDDFTYVLHLAATITPSSDYDESIRINAEGTGLLLRHCRRAKAALVMSTQSIYQANEDPFYVYTETSPLGVVSTPFAPTYSVSKLAQEAVARYGARDLGLPVMIARMNCAYGPKGTVGPNMGLIAQHVHAILRGDPVVTKHDPAPYSPIYEDDISEQAAALLGAASVPATIVNWAGDEVVTVQEWCAEIGRLTGREATVKVASAPNTQLGAIADNTKRTSITGPCKMPWKEGVRRLVEACTAEA